MNVLENILLNELDTSKFEMQFDLFILIKY